jgi:hypothetical protein
MARSTSATGPRSDVGLRMFASRMIKAGSVFPSSESCGLPPQLPIT